MKNKQSDVLFYYTDGTADIGEPSYLKKVKRVKVVGLELNDFQVYMTLNTKERIKYIMEHGENFNY